jgi:hypothetical protein
MKMNKAKLAISAALVMAVSAAGIVKAEEPDMAQTRAQDRVRTEVNLQAHDNEAAQARMREQKMEPMEQKKMHQEKAQMHQGKAQMRNEYKKNIQPRQNGSASGSMMRQNMMNQTRSKH